MVITLELFCNDDPSLPHLLIYSVICLYQYRFMDVHFTSCFIIQYYIIYFIIQTVPVLVIGCSSSCILCSFNIFLHLFEDFWYYKMIFICLLSFLAQYQNEPFFQANTGFFYWRIVFRTQNMGIEDFLCHWHHFQALSGYRVS